jgi:hypothetical protein
MSMPGFVYYLLCPKCQKTSPDYPLYVFPDIFSAEIVLPAWSSQFRCFAEMRCFLKPEDRGILEKNRSHLGEFVSQLASPGVTVGFPVWSVEADCIRVSVVPSPICPFCGCSAEARAGYPPKEVVGSLQNISDPYAVPLPMLGLSVRAFNCLHGAEIGTLGELCERSPEELLSIPHFGAATLQEVREKVEAAGWNLRER